MVLQTPRIIHLNHCITYIAAAARQSVAAAASGAGPVTLWQPADDKQPLVFSTLDLERHHAISLHPIHPLLAVVEHNGRLIVSGLDKSNCFKLDPPKRHETGSQHLGFHSCLYDKGGEYLWCVTRVNDEKFEVQLRRVADISIVSAVEVNDPFPGCSWAVLFESGNSQAATLWLSTGQTDTQVQWMTYSASDGLRCDHEPNLEYSLHPVFSPDGQEFLVPTGLDGLSRYRWSKKRWGQNLRCPTKNDNYSYFLAYLDDNHALVGTHYGRVYLVHSKKMRIVEEVIIDGHSFKVLDDPQVNSTQKSFSTDLSGFWRIGDCVAFAFPARRKAIRGDCDDLLLFDIEAILPRT